MKADRSGKAEAVRTEGGRRSTLTLKRVQRRNVTSPPCASGVMNRAVHFTYRVTTESMPLRRSSMIWQNPSTSVTGMGMSWFATRAQTSSGWTPVIRGSGPRPPTATPSRTSAPLSIHMQKTDVSGSLTCAFSNGTASGLREMYWLSRFGSPSGGSGFCGDMRTLTAAMAAFAMGKRKLGVWLIMWIRSRS